MSLSHIDAKLAHVRHSLTAKEIAHLTAAHHPNDYLLLDMIYGITKHSNWLETPVFKHLLGASLAGRHGLEFEECQRLLTATTAEFIKIKRLNPVERSDCDFIRYVFILTLSITDEQKLILEIGLGRQFLRKLKVFLQQVSKGDKAQSFLFGFEALCYETLVNLAADLIGNHDKLAKYRLHYQLLSAQDKASLTQQNEADEEALLTLLCRMHAEPLTVRDIDSRQIPASLSATKLVARLSRSGLIYHGDFLARKKLYVWRVTALGAEIAALALNQRQA